MGVSMLCMFFIEFALYLHSNVVNCNSNIRQGSNPSKWNEMAWQTMLIFDLCTFYTTIHCLLLSWSRRSLHCWAMTVWQSTTIRGSPTSNDGAVTAANRRRRGWFAFSSNRLHEFSSLHLSALSIHLFLSLYISPIYIHASSQYLHRVCIAHTFLPIFWIDVAWELHFMVISCEHIYTYIYAYTLSHAR